jgi:hypothetical protein
MNILKSIWAIVAGMLVGAVLSIGTDLILEKTGIFPPQQSGLFVAWMLGLALIYRCIYNTAGCYVAAALAPNRPMGHALTLGGIGLVVTILGSIANWSASASAAWYPIALIVLTLPAAWLGGKLKTS